MCSNNQTELVAILKAVVRAERLQKSKKKILLDKEIGQYVRCVCGVYRARSLVVFVEYIELGKQEHLSRVYNAQKALEKRSLDSKLSLVEQQRCVFFSVDQDIL